MNFKTWLLWKLVLFTVLLPAFLNILIRKTSAAARRKYTPEPKPKSDYCYLKLDKGPCNNLEQRSWYNSKTGECEYFLYGGCKGNKNNFISIEECIDNCEPDYIVLE